MQDSEIRLAVEDAPPDIKRCAAAIVQQREQRALQALAVGLVQSPRFQRAMQIERNKRKPAYASSGMITRGQPTLASMEANLQNLKRRGAELTRQAQRERRGW